MPDSREAEIRKVWENRHIIAEQKKNTLKQADVVLNHYQPGEVNPVSKSHAFKAADDPTKLLVSLVINTTNIIDSHMDCHIPGIWDKTLQETKLFYLLQEHVMDYRHIIADSVKDNLKASADMVPWSQLGYSYPGSTQALMFKATISRSRNAFMFDQYEKGYVLNHSVGMRYVKLFLCINSEEPDYSAEKENWDKYYSQVMNKEVADLKGYFWAVTEANMVEGSAVVKGSNPATPVLSTEAIKDNGGAAPSTPTDTEPAPATQKTTISNFLF